ncbi:MAG: hypothetical protein DRJ03_00545 [Chloroflexi bacterium]|nr:MAG: hypothetical protein DRJ03_00545 [Chloroflexota bacterium]
MAKWWRIIMPTIVFLVSCGDLGTTLYFDRTCSDFQEANPIALHVWENFGDGGLVVFKLTITLLSCTTMGWVLRHKKRPWRVAVSVFGIVGCVILVGWWLLYLYLL